MAECLRITNEGASKRQDRSMASHQRQQQQSTILSFFGANGSVKRKIGHSHSNKKKKLIRQANGGSSYGSCPLCERSFSWHNLEQHASTCQGKEGGSSDKGTTKIDNASDQFALDESDVSTNSAGQQVNSVQVTDEPIPGLFVYEDFITEEEEALILEELDGKPTSVNLDSCNDDKTTHSEKQHLPWKLAKFNGVHYGKRWGVHCNLRDRMVSEPENPLPDFLQQIILPRLQRLKPMSGCIPNEANAIDYRRTLGHYLSAHVDDRQLSKEPIANLSLAGNCFMTFRNVATHRNVAVPVARVYLPRRCLQILTGRARYDFSHAIDHADLLSDRRVSITMRESPLTVRIKDRLEKAKVPTSTTTTSTRSGCRTLSPRQRPLLLPFSSKPDSLCHTDEPIRGLFLFEDFITEDEEKIIMNELDNDAHQKWTYEKHSGTHCEKRFGVDHDLWNPYSVRPGKHPLPAFMTTILIPRLARISASIMQGCVPNEVNSISYRRSQGHFLASHVDDRKKHKETIANLSLAGDCFMTYQLDTQRYGAGLGDSNKKKILLKRRCLQVMTGKARYEYAHGIENQDLLSDRRVSLTMRETRQS
ncbi:hypothetical protein ACA910_002397 [Epithemia clementina (nom. ined.)]